MDTRVMAIVIAFSSFAILGSMIFTEYHESVHRSIYEVAGAKNITTQYFLGGAHTTADFTSNSSIGFSNAYNLQNEIIGYHSFAILLNVWLIFGLYLAFGER